jgi:vacuolar-type H+-ATPase subunit F/Vma7
MAQAAVIGESVRTAGFALAGALVFPAENAIQARAAWALLPADVAIVMLTPRAAAWLGTAPRSRRDVLLVVLPP